ncbi:glutathione peroxidase [Phreatobacter sp.]|uniref:glutathione peroxidase n=1 Tax=Phreatobacter sp. TaxID=1966341 RepID=UPI003F6EA0B9
MPHVHLSRRALLATAAGLAASGTALAQSASVALSSSTAYAYSFEGLEGGMLRLADHAGRVLLVVNTASSCGFTPQYTDLQQVWTRFRDRGLTVIGVPSDDFNQERGSAREIAEFCSGVYGVTFPMTAKQRVRGPQAHPFYRWVAGQRPADIPTWNFHKYVIGRSGQVIGAFPARVRPTDPRILAMIEAQLGVS